METETAIIAKAFCHHEGCGFTPQTVTSENQGVGATVEWLQGRKRHHDKTHDHPATLIIYSQQTK